MKKKFMKRTVSLVLSIVMIFSMMTVGVVNTYAAEDGIGDIIPGMGIINAVGGRLFNEFTSYCIGNEVTFLGDFFYITLCDPVSRARIEANQTIQEINKTVNEIKAALRHGYPIAIGVKWYSDMKVVDGVLTTKYQENN